MTTYSRPPTTPENEWARFRGFPYLFNNDDTWQRQQQLQLQLPTAMANDNDDGWYWGWAYKGTPTILFIYFATDY